MARLLIHIVLLAAVVAASPAGASDSGSLPQAAGGLRVTRLTCDYRQIREGRLRLAQMSGVQLLRWETGRAVLSLASGRYAFESKFQ